jgi:hypothetical protein
MSLLNWDVSFSEPAGISIARMRRSFDFSLETFILNNARTLSSLRKLDHFQLHE